MSTTETPKPEKLASERIIINAPMSFAGAAQRSWRLRKSSGAAKAAWTAVAILVLLVWWTAVACWYLLFGLFLIPYRILRRGSRKRKVTAMQHREMLAAVEREKQAG